MASAVNDQKNGWDARLKRIQTGQTMTQIAEAEGTVPLQYAKESRKQDQRLTGLSAWVAAGTFGWGIATVIGRLDPAASLAERFTLRDFAPLVDSFANPLLGFLCFVLALSMLRVAGFFSKIAGIAIMAWVFAVQAEMGVPSLADLAGLTHSVVTGEIAISDTFTLIQSWGASAPA